MAEPARVWDVDAARDAALIVNVGSRKGLALYRRARETLLNLGVEVCHPCRLSTPDAFGDSIGDALDRGTRLVIIGGGDGTINSAVNILAGRNVVLGVLPMGTGNDFARTLGIPLDLQGACRVIAGGRVERVDLGQVNGRHFVNTVGIGFTAHAAHHLLPHAKRLLGRGAYVLAAARALVGYHGFHVRARLDDWTEEFEALEVIVGNGRFHSAGTLLAPSASIVSGRLVSYAFGALSRWQMVKMALAVYRGRHVYHRQMHFHVAREIEIEANPRQAILADGERCGYTPALIRVMHRALPVVVPEPS